MDFKLLQLEYKALPAIPSKETFTKHYYYRNGEKIAVKSKDCVEFCNHEHDNELSEEELETLTKETVFDKDSYIAEYSKASARIVNYWNNVKMVYFRKLNITSGIYTDQLFKQIVNSTKEKNLEDIFNQLKIKTNK